MADPLVSVIMPCRNGGGMLRRALSSVLAQTYPHVEVIFVDDGSTDDSAAVAGSFAAAAGRSIRVTANPAPGVNNARNHGYGLASGDYIQWLDADDELAPGKLAAQVVALERDDAVDIAYCDYTSRRQLAGGAPLDLTHRVWQTDDQLLRALSGHWYATHGHLVRRAAADRLAAAQAWFPGRPVGTDIEYFALAAALGMRFRHVAEAHVVYNIWSPAQMTASIELGLRIRTMSAIFARLRDVAAQPEHRRRITAQHRLLLGQNWDVWQMPPGSVAIAPLPGRRSELRHVASGRRLVVRPREALVARELLATPQPRPFFNHARNIAGHVAELEHEHPAIIATLDRLRAAGLLTRVMSVDGPAG